MGLVVFNSYNLRPLRAKQATFRTTFPRTLPVRHVIARIRRLQTDASPSNYLTVSSGMADSSFNFMAFFFIFFLQCVLAFFQSLGISGWGACGWLATVMFFSTNVISAIFMLICTLLFTVVTVLMGFVLLKVHRLYRGGGGSFQRAQEEWSTGAWKNPAVREAGFNAISETGPSLPQYPAAVPNYPESGPW
ncbi:Secretory carrier-associated membrane protein 4 [Anabarilius grahami]|uniref:Secretory carrier-associated membrane protein n=1 Tax=Anabarilius grahami TaxID=495550 RepID=A0A3N0Y3K0_ANAGA|nr:Secretory carrier-associated membrane protein 4 [Anabarilius grahami]